MRQYEIMIAMRAGPKPPPKKTRKFTSQPKKEPALSSASAPKPKTDEFGNLLSPMLNTELSLNHPNPVPIESYSNNRILIESYSSLSSTFPLPSKKSQWTSEQENAVVSGVDKFGFDFAKIKSENEDLLSNRNVTRMQFRYEKLEPQKYKEWKSKQPRASNPVRVAVYGPKNKPRVRIKKGKGGISAKEKTSRRDQGNKVAAETMGFEDTKVGSFVSS